MNERPDLAEVFTRQWAAQSSPDLGVFLAAAGPVDAVQLSRLARIDQAERWQRSDRRSVEEYFLHFPPLQADHDSAVDLIYHEFLLREKLSEEPSLEEFTSRFPRHAIAIAEQVSFHRALATAGESVGDDLSTRTEASRAARIESPLLRQLPAEFGRYRVLQLLGRGGMGSVYIAEDTQLGRRVALKLPRVDRNVSPGVCDRFRREARIAATFHHPNLCPVYDFGELDGTLFLTMPCMAGQPLSTRLQAGRLSEREAVQITVKIARAMSVAHQAGVVHRDLKPSNILLRDDGEPVVMDFGLAWREFDLVSKLFDSGAFVGTLAYMPPEQLQPTNDAISPVSDVYSLGVMLYELLTGRLPFAGSWRDVWEQINSQPPLAPSHHEPTLSPRLDRICLQAMAKDPRDRFGSMGALADALTQLGERNSIPAVFAYIGARSPPRRLTVMAVATACLLAVAGWFAWRTAGLEWARQQVPQIEKLAEAGQFFEAYELAGRTRKYLPEDAKLTRLLTVVSDILSVRSEPAGARVYAKRFVADPAAAAPRWTLVGTTPLADLEIARGEYVVSVEKEGYAPFQRTWSGVAAGGLDAPIVFPPMPIDVRLTPVAAAQSGMVFVPGGEYRLVAWRRPTDALVKLDDYFVDRCEVTNGEYQLFVDAGGYTDERFWTHPFVKDGRELPRKEAMLELRDRTGRAGPRQWSNQTFPDGRANHPVTGITWYEAEAYAAFRGKSLPTIFQWEKAARDGVKNPMGQMMPWGLLQGSPAARANFAGKGTIPVGDLEFGMSPFGCYEMAGNVSEWCLNATTEGFISNGSSWGSYAYEFGWYATYPGFYSSERLGFRCVSKRADATGDQGGSSINIDNEVPRYTAEPEAKVRKWFVNYDHREPADLDGRVVEVKETKAWRREKISFVGADGAPALAYLYLPPRHFSEPYQVIHLVPAGDVLKRHISLPQSIEANYGSFVQSGRAVFSVVLAGYVERDRPRRWTEPDVDSWAFVEEEARQIVDLRRGIDYLQTRDDVDASKIALMVASAGGMTMALPAIDARYRAEVLWGASIRKSQLQVHPEARAINFVPLIRVPKLLVQGLYDEMAPRLTEWQPLYDLLPEPKEKKFFPGGHVPDAEFLVPVVNTFLDEQLGCVRVGPAAGQSTRSAQNASTVIDE